MRSGGVIAHATDTCYGFACDAFNQRALARLYKIKKMPAAKPVSIIIYSSKEARRLGIFNKKALALARAYWPGPLTIIVRRKKILPKFLNPKSKTIGIRLPGDKLSRMLSRALGRPITTTSANISGKKPLYSADEMHWQFAREKFKPDFILDSGRLNNKNKPSTIIDVSGGKLIIARQGDIQIEKV